MKTETGKRLKLIGGGVMSAGIIAFFIPSAGPIGSLLLVGGLVTFVIGRSND